ncbi:MAG: ABC transporter ATP-binding protein [Heteroscytonema crispum UTEX LB 1556]
MSDTVIRVENLSKKYVLAHQEQGSVQYKTFSGAITNAAKSLANALNPRSKKEVNRNREEFWALKDVSFEIKQGDRIGIVGRNGAGKSTLLKILSRITEPTSGSIRIKGRVASLLEVGTGFHPELTGRENIFLNGAILGMSKVEIKRKFDEIVAFAEIEKFLDTPVKRYSSGMYVRLAFAVAAHLDPEILIIDEVLAVGDAKFQRKCLAKMEDVGKEGRTVLFVSHQMVAIKKLCSRAILLQSGKVQFDGNVESAIDYYLDDYSASFQQDGSVTTLLKMKRSGSGDIRLTGFSTENLTGGNLILVCSGEEIIFNFHYELMNNKEISDLSIGFSIHNSYGDPLTIFYSDYVGQIFSTLPNRGIFKCKIKDFPLSSGRYFIGARVVLINGIEVDWPQGYVGFIDVQEGPFYREGNIRPQDIGPVLIRGDWELKAI